jgi:molecular chaperone GrpE
MAEPRRKPGTGEDRPLHEVSAGTDGSDDVGAGLASPADLQTRVEELELRLAETEAERDERLNDLKRLAADFDNYRKRVAREHAALAERANERLLNELLPVLDDLERALEAAAEHEEVKLEEGGKLVHRSFLALLERHGLSEIEANGAFDPHVHEALLAQPAEDAEEGSVLQVLQKGYRLGDRVLRPARVIVAK